MFHKTRLKLTAWYLIIIMAISISFSTVIYFGTTREFDRVLRVQEYRFSHPSVNKNLPAPLGPDQIGSMPDPDSEVIQEAKLREIENLAIVNIFIFIFSALAGYFLAGRTLKPIKDMLDEQNRFITDASHELNTPLTALKTSLEINLRDKNFNIKKAKDVLNSNLDDVNNLQSLSDELIILTQYQKPNGNFKLENVSILEVLENALEKVKPIANKKHIKFSLSSEKYLVKANERSIIELFVILFDNAIKYSKEKTLVKVTVKKTDSKIEVKVKDEGIGISKEDLSLIFDRFYRADKSRTKQQVAGYGLGLSIAKRIVSLHKGEIYVESAPGKGTTFAIVLLKS